MLLEFLARQGFEVAHGHAHDLVAAMAGRRAPLTAQDLIPLDIRVDLRDSQQFAAVGDRVAVIFPKHEAVVALQLVDLAVEPSPSIDPQEIVRAAGQPLHSAVQSVEDGDPRLLRDLERRRQVARQSFGVSQIADRQRGHVEVTGRRLAR